MKDDEGNRGRSPEQLLDEERTRLIALVEAGEAAPPDRIRASLDRLHALTELAQPIHAHRQNFIPAILFVVSALVVLCLAVVPVQRTPVEIQVNTEYFWTHVPGGMSGYGENLGKCNPDYYSAGMQLWPVRNAVRVHAQAEAIPLADGAPFGSARFSSGGEFSLMRANAERFLVDGWGVAGNTDLVVSRIPTEAMLTLQFTQRHEDGASWWLPCVQFTPLDVVASDASTSGWSLSSPAPQSDAFDATAIAAALAGTPNRVMTEVDTRWLYASSDGPEVVLEVELADSSRQPIYSGKPVKIKALKLGPWEQGSPDRCADQEFKPIRGGTLRLLEFNRVIQLYPSDCLDIKWEELFLMGVETSRDGVHLRVRGSVSEISVFTSAANNAMPSYLEWLYAQQSLAVIWGAITFLAGLGIAFYRWAGQIR